MISPSRPLTGISVAASLVRQDGVCCIILKRMRSPGVAMGPPSPGGVPLCSWYDLAGYLMKNPDPGR